MLQVSVVVWSLVLMSWCNILNRVDLLFASYIVPLAGVAPENGLLAWMYQLKSHRFSFKFCLLLYALVSCTILSFKQPSILALTKQSLNSEIVTINTHDAYNYTHNRVGDVTHQDSVWALIKAVLYANIHCLETIVEVKLKTMYLFWSSRRFVFESGPVTMRTCLSVMMRMPSVWWAGKSFLAGGTIRNLSFGLRSREKICLSIKARCWIAWHHDVSGLIGQLLIFVCALPGWTLRGAISSGECTRLI